MEEKTEILPFFVFIKINERAPTGIEAGSDIWRAMAKVSGMESAGMERSGMIFTEQSPVYQRNMGGTNIIMGKDRTGIISEKSRWNSPSIDKNREDFFDHISKASEKAAEGAGEKEEIKNKDAGEAIKDSSGKEDETSREALMRVISEQREEILRKLKNGDTGVRISIGSMSLTQEEWDRLMDSFDKAQEKIQESIRKENGESLPEKRPDTTVNGDKVFATEDTGHEAKSLEDLISEAGIEGKVEDQPLAQQQMELMLERLLTSEEENEKSENL